MTRIFRLSLLLFVGTMLAAFALTSCGGDDGTDEPTPQWVTLDKTSNTITEGESFTLTPTFSSTATSKLEFAWTSSGTSVATVTMNSDKSATVTAVKAGTTTIKIQCKSDATIKAECTLTVSADDKWVTLDKTSHSLTEGEAFTLTPTFGSTGTSALEFEWTSSVPAVASVAAKSDKSATVTALKAGTTTIKIQCKSNSAIKAECALTVTEKEEESDGIVRILAIGNSFSQDAVEQYLYNLFDAAGIEVIIGNLYIGGCSLETHYNNSQSNAASYEYRKVVKGSKAQETGKTMQHGITNENWDYIVLQQASPKSGQYDTYTPYLQGLIDYVKANATNKKLKIGFHQTWAYASSYTDASFNNYGKDQMTMYNAITSATSQVMAAYGDLKFIAPSGTAIQNGRNSYLGDTFNRDGTHLEVTYGRYTAACTWFETISGQSVVGNSYAPATVDNTQKAIAQNAAHFAVLKPFEVNPMANFQTPEIGEFKAPVYIDFGQSTTTLSSPTVWNNVAANSLTASDPKIYLKDREDDYTAISITSISGFTSIMTGVSTEPDKAMVLDGVSYPKSVWADAFIAGPAVTATIELSGFEAGVKYDLTLLAVRWEGTYQSGSDDVRKTRFTVTGSTTPAAQSINPGITKKSSHPSAEAKALSYEDYFDYWFANDVPMTQYAVTFSGIAPDASGKIKVEMLGVGANAVKEAHINAMVISKSN